jgi:hypothetical protein
LRRTFLVPAVVLAALLLPTLATCNADALEIRREWFDEPENHRDHWKIMIGPPVLTYSQRLVIPANALIPLPRKNEPRNELYFVIRIADDQGRWFPGADYDRINLADIHEKEGTINWHSAIFVRPGKYSVVVVIYDVQTKQHFVWRKSINVQREHVLPDLDQSLPMVEFADARGFHAPLGEHLPIENRKPLRVDVVLNLTGDLQMTVAPGRWRAFRHYSVESALMGAVSAFTQLQPAVGCVRVSALDIVHREVARDRALADPGTDWVKVRETLTKNRDQMTVDVRTLEGRVKSRQFFHDFLARVIADNSGCGPDLASTDRAVVVVSDSLMFPSGSIDEPVPTPAQSNARFFHVQIRFNGMPVFDQVGHMLHDLHPRHFDIDDPHDLRKALSGIISDLEKPVTEGSRLE